MRFHKLERAKDPNFWSVSGNVEDRRSTVSVFNGPAPAIKVCNNHHAEALVVSEWITEGIKSGLQPNEIGVFVRTESQIEQAIAAFQRSSQTPAELDRSGDRVLKKSCPISTSPTSNLDERC